MAVTTEHLGVSQEVGDSISHRAAVLSMDGNQQVCVCSRVHWEDLLQLS